MLRGQQMTCQSDISLLTTHIVLTHIIVYFFMLMQCVAKQPYAILMHKVSHGHPKALISAP